MTDAVDVAVATEADAPDLLPLFRAFYREPQTEDGVPRHMAAARAFDTVILARLDGEAVGFASLRILPQVEGGTPHAEVSDIYVDPDARRRGVGTQLMAFAEGLARSRGATRIVLITGFDNPTAQAFYRRIGYRDWALAMEKGLEG